MKRRRINFMIRGVLCALISIITTMAMIALSNFSPAVYAAKSPNVNIHIINMPYNDPSVLASRVYTYPGLDGMSGSKSVTANTLGVSGIVGSAHEYEGMSYTYQGAFVMVNPDATDVVTTMPGQSQILDRIGINASSTENPPVVTVKYKDGNTYEYSFDGTNDYDLYISPVYAGEPVYELSFNWVDRIAHNSGSWSNGPDNPVSHYEHTFSSPSSGEVYNHYQFQHWKSGDKVYQAGNTYRIFNGDESHDMDVYAYAMWKPSVTVNYYVDGHQTNSKEDFESVRVYEYEPEIEGKTFEGWYDADGNRIDDATIYDAPPLTGEEDAVEEPLVCDVYARFSEPGPGPGPGPEPEPEPDPEPPYDDGGNSDNQDGSNTSSADSVNTGDGYSYMVWAFAMMISGMHIVVGPRS